MRSLPSKYCAGPVSVPAASIGWVTPRIVSSPLTTRRSPSCVTLEAVKVISG